MEKLKTKLQSMNFRTWNTGLRLQLVIHRGYFLIDSNSDDNFGLAFPKALSKTLGIETDKYINNIGGNLYSVLFRSANHLGYIKTKY